MLTESLLRKLWPHVDEAKPGMLAAIAASAPAVFTKYNLGTPLLVAHAMAQFSEEIGADNPSRSIEFDENLSYSAGRIPQVWPSRFGSTAAGLPYAHNPKKLGDKVYGGRMGNRPGTDDGYDFRGRGGSQVTGRDGYSKLAAKTGLDLLGNPDLVNAPEHFLECAVADFVLCGCLPFAAKDDVRGVTHHLNGGYIGLSERMAWLKRWKAALSAERPDEAPVGVPPPPRDGSLRYGDHGWEVKAVQEQLTALGYYHGKDDGDFGSGTRAAVLAFQANEDVPTTGIVDPQTRDALAKAPPKPVTEDRLTADTDDLRESGSETVAHADSMGTMGKTAIGTGAVAAANEAGAFDRAKEAVEAVGGPHEAFDFAQKAIEWITAHLWIGAIVGGIAAIYFGRKIISARLADHRSGANMAR